MVSLRSRTGCRRLIRPLAGLAATAVLWSVQPAPGASASAGVASGSVFIDESLHPLAGVTMQLVDGAGSVVATTVTDANGDYSFGGPAGAYTVRQVQPPTYLPGAVEPDNEITVTLADDTTVPDLDFSETVTRKQVCATPGSPAPVFGLVSGSPILEWDSVTRSRIPSTIPAVPSSINTSGQFNALMVDPVQRRIVIEVNPAVAGKAAFLAAYDERKGGWYRASNDIMYDNGGVATKLTGNVPRGGFGPDGVGYLAFAYVGGGLAWKITPNGAFDYEVTEIEWLSEHPISGATSGDLAFDASGRGWFLAGAASGSPSGVTMQLSRFTPSETPGVRSAVDPYLRLTYNGGDVPTAWNLTGFAFGGDGYGYITTNNGSPRGMYRFDLATGVLTRIDPSDTTYAGLNWYDAGSCAHPAVDATLGVVKEVVAESGSAPGIAEPGETLTYAIRVTNTGAIAQTLPGSAVTETIPAHTSAAGAGDSFSFVAGAPAGTTGTATGQTQLAPGAHLDLTLRVVVDATLPSGPVSIVNLVGVARADCAEEDCVATIGGGGAISGSVFEDGTAAPVAGTTLTLLDGSGAAVAVTVTDAAGRYAFAHLTPGVYTVVEAQPAGYEPGIVVPGNSIDVTLPLGGSSTGNDFSEMRLASVGDRVWNDLDADGIQDDGEPGLGGAVVELLGTGGAVVASTVSAADGSYGFSGVRPGSYRVRFATPAGLVAAPVETAPSDVGSDADGDGRSPAVTLVSGDARTDIDAGFFAPGSVSGTAWTDANGDGIVGVNEPPIAGATVTLTGTDLFGNPVSLTSTTGADGSYSFADVLPGSYTVTVSGVARPMPVDVAAGRPEVRDFRFVPVAHPVPPAPPPSPGDALLGGGSRHAAGLAVTGGGPGLAIAGIALAVAGAAVLVVRRRTHPRRAPGSGPRGL